MDILLKGLTWFDGPNQIRADVRIKEGFIHDIGHTLSAGKKSITLSYNNHFLYPGLINAHDHLEMNLYPKLGKPPYRNYMEWARDIYKPKESPLREIEKLDIKERLMWGGLKNLVSGVTTVVHHNPWHRLLGSDKYPVKALKKMAWAHSLAFEKQLQRKFHDKKVPFIIHAGEGIDETASAEIATLDELNLLQANTVLVHAISLNEVAIARIRQQGASIVWCPASNSFMFGITCPVDKIKKTIPLALGSDSTLTGSPTLLHEIKAARASGMVTDKEVYDMVTRNPAKIFGLQPPRIAIGETADLFIAPIKSADYYANLMMTEPEDLSAVMVNGKIRLCDANAHKRLNQSFRINGEEKFIDFDLGNIMKRIRKTVPQSYLEANPLWQWIDA